MITDTMLMLFKIILLIEVDEIDIVDTDAVY